MPSIVVGIAGATSSGKTTLSLILSEIFGDVASSVVHQDNFFVEKSSPEADCDCWEAVDVDSLVSQIREAKYSGGLIQSNNLKSVFGENLAAVEQYKPLINAMREKFEQWVKEETEKNARSRLSGDFTSLLHSYNNSNQIPAEKPSLIPKICLVDGFLLYSQSDNLAAHSKCRHSCEIDPKQQLMELIDIKLFLPVSKSISRERRFTRTPYMDAPAGSRLPNQYWKTDKYFEAIAWPNYVRENSFLFDNGCVESIPFGVGLRHGVTPEKAGVFMLPIMDASVIDTVKWAVEVILKELENVIRRARYPSIPEEEDSDASDGEMAVETPGTPQEVNGLGIEDTEHVQQADIVYEAVELKKKGILRRKLKVLKEHVREGFMAIKSFCRIDSQGNGKARDVGKNTVPGTPLSLFTKESWRRGHGRRGDGTISRMA